MWNLLTRHGAGSKDFGTGSVARTKSGDDASLRQRLNRCRIDALEREIAGEFGTEALAPLLEELAARRAQPH